MGTKKKKASKKRGKKATKKRKASKKVSKKARKRKAKRVKGTVPLAILERRQKKLTALVKRRGGTVAS